MASYLAPTLQRSAGSTARGLRCAPVELQQHGVGSMTARRTRRKASLFLIDQKGSTRAHSSPQASSALTDNDGISTIDALSMGPPIVVPVRPRPSVSAPEPPPLLHSPTFLQQTLSSRSMSSLDEDAQGSSGASAAPIVQPGYSSRASSPPAPPEPLSSNAIEWALYRADQSLNRLEQEPLPLQKTLYEISRGPVGEAAGSAVQATAKVTVEATKAVVRAATPLAKWALTEGAKVAAGLIKTAVVEGVKAEGRRKLAEKRAQEQAQLEKRAARAKSVSRGTPRPKQR